MQLLDGLRGNPLDVLIHLIDVAVHCALDLLRVLLHGEQLAGQAGNDGHPRQHENGNEGEVHHHDARPARHSLLQCHHEGIEDERHQRRNRKHDDDLVDVLGDEDDGIQGRHNPRADEHPLPGKRLALDDDAQRLPTRKPDQFPVPFLERLRTPLTRLCRLGQAQDDTSSLVRASMARLASSS